MNSAYVEGYRVIRATERTVRRWLHTHGATRKCDQCDKPIEPGQWFVSGHATVPRAHQYHTHVACLNYARCSRPDALKAFARRQQSTRLGDRVMDLADRHRITKIMESLGYRCSTDQYLMIKKRQPDPDKHCFPIHEVYGHLRKMWKAAAMTGVTCFNKYGQLRVIIELVGTRADPGSHAVYDGLDIPYVLVNREHCELKGITWEDWITNEMRRKKIAE